MRTLLILPALALLSAASPADQRRFLLSSFDRIRVDGPFAITIREGSPGAVATGDRRALAGLAIRVEGATLIVSAGAEGWRSAGTRIETPSIAVTARNLATILVNGGAVVDVDTLTGHRVELGLNGSGSIRVAAIRADELVATLTGTGMLDLAGRADKARFRIYGAGGVDATKLTLGDAVIASETSGSIRANARYSAQIVALGAGSVRIEGGAECSITGPGPASCAGPTKRR
ncbi:MAG: GIN domain-containing protein [Pseudomonadota bacterium]